MFLRSPWGDEVQWLELEDDVRCAVTVPRLQLVTDVAIRRKPQAPEVRNRPVA
jgi:hypothetical protein